MKQKLSSAKTQRGLGRLVVLVSCTCVALIILVPLATIAWMLDSQPLVSSAPPVDTSSAIKAKQVAKQLNEDLLHGELGRVYTLRISESELNGIVALAGRGAPRFRGRVNLTPMGIMSAFTIGLADNPFGEYLNLAISITPSQKGLLIDNVRLGTLDISGNLALSVLEAALNAILAGDAFGTRVLNAIDSVEVDEQWLVLAYHSLPGLKTSIESTKEQLKEVRDDIALLADPKLVRLYYEHLCTFHSQLEGVGRPSAGYYLSAAFSLAEQRSYISEQPVDENRAALLALATFLGSSRFDSLVGAIDQETLAACQPRSSQIGLANRKDLRQHFIYSAVLKVIADSGVSFAIGEFKEMLDSGQGGSGFSFADLAADRTGIRFAELALDDSSATRLQQMALKLTQENIFFPSIEGLPEGLPQAQFDALGGIEGQYYEQYLRLIDDRIDELALYKAY